MEASLLAVTAPPVPPQNAPSQAAQTTEKTSPFTSFMSAALTANKEPQEETEEMDPDASNSIPGQLAGQQDMSMAAGLTALSFQDMTGLTASQLVPEQEITTGLTSITDASTPILSAPEELQQFQAMVTADGQSASALAPPATEKQPATSPPVFGLRADLPAQPATEKQPAISSPVFGLRADLLAQPATEKQPATPLNKTDALLTQQLQTLLAGDSQDTLTIRTSYQPLPAETLNGLTSPYLQSAAGSTPIAPLLPAHTAMLKGAIDGTKTTDTVEGVRQNIAEQFQNAKLEALSDKNNANSQQQETGQHENSTNQQNSANAILTTSLSNNDLTGQFNLTALGAQTIAATPTNGAAAHPVALSPGVAVPAEEVINHLVERFSINPRLQTSKISLNLNPAELGALKIDILVKGDSIKAHIVANSQQIQETIERHMPKLRTILEQQGFTIEDFKVTLESATSDSQNFFHQQFSSGQDSAPQTTLAGSEDSFDLSLNSAEEILSASRDSGINLNI